MRLAGIDLNLLTALDALLDERNVTRAARRLGVTQPAASHRLARLRALLGDPLLVRTPAGLAATPRARELHPAVRAALAAAQAVLEPAPAFTPATATRVFTLTMADLAAFLLVPRLAARLAREAPGVELRVRPAPDDTVGALASGELDLAIGVYGDAPAGARTHRLWDEAFACVIRRARGARPLDLDAYLARAHVVVAPRGRPGSAIDELLARRGQARRIAITVPHFLVAPAIVASTELVWTAPMSLARAFAATYPLAIHPPPLPVAGFTLSTRWHARFDRDPGLAWLRGVIAELAP